MFENLRRNRNEEIIWFNVLYQYSNQKRMGFRNFIIFIRDLLMTYVIIKRTHFIKSKIIVNDTKAANINDQINFILKNSDGSIELLNINYSSNELRLLRIVSTTTAVFIATAHNVLSYLNIVDGRYVIAKRIAMAFIKRLRVLKSCLQPKKTICFYEKSLLNMIMYCLTDSFIVIQHGLPTHTYWPSLAEVYLTWGDKFTNYMSDKQPNIKFTTVGCTLPISLPTSNVVEFDLLFLSQVGSRDTLKSEVIQTKKFVAKMQSSGASILVRLHPSEVKTKQSNNDSTLSHDIARCEVVTSCYSTALLMAGSMGKRVCSINSGQSCDEFSLLRSFGIPNMHPTGSIKKISALATEIPQPFERYEARILNEM
jgi:hypothetical protein